MNLSNSSKSVLQHCIINLISFYFLPPGSLYKQPEKDTHNSYNIVGTLVGVTQLIRFSLSIHTLTQSQTHLLFTSKGFYPQGFIVSLPMKWGGKTGNIQEQHSGMHSSSVIIFYVYITIKLDINPPYMWKKRDSIAEL